MPTQGYPAPGEWNFQIPNLPAPPAGQPIVNQPGITPAPPASSVTSPTGSVGGSYRGGSGTGGTTTPRVEPPDQWRQTPGSFTGATGPIYNMYDPYTYNNPQRFQEANRYLSSWYVPQQQMAQNSFQWGNEFNEAQRRWGISNQQQNQMNQYGMGLQTRQQQMAEWEAQKARDQWTQQFGWTQETDRWSQALAQQELAQRVQLRMLQDAAAERQANIMAFGRADKPNARYVRNWG